MTLPLGVKTKTSSYSRSIFSDSMNSPGSEVSCCQSTMRCSQSRSSARLALLVAPVRGDAELGAPVHLLGADLHLDRLARRPDDRGVQRLVEVELGHRDVVLEPALDRLPHRVDRAERGVAVLHRLDDDAHADEVLHVVELLAARDHLLVDRPVVLRAALDLGLDVELVEAGPQVGEHGRRGTPRARAPASATICSISA